MKGTKYLITLLLSLVLGFSLQAQEGITGEWRVHAPYNKAQNICQAGSRIYGVSNVSLFYFDKDDNSLNEMSKINELSDISVSALAYNEDKDITLLCYKNGNIDAIQGNKLVNINDIKRSSISGSKRINNVIFHGDFAYLACDFGLVKVDLVDMEVTETYRNIGPNGSQLEVFDNAIDLTNDSIYLATNIGLLGANLHSESTLINFNSWQQITDTSGTPIEETIQVEYFNDTLYIARSKQKIVGFKNNILKTTKFPSIGWGDIYFMRASRGKMIVGVYDQLGIASNSQEIDTVYNKVWPIQNVRDALLDEDGVLWLADNSYGVSSNRTGDFQTLSPNGPHSIDVFEFFSHDDKVIAVSGGHSATFVPFWDKDGFYLFENNAWKSYKMNTASTPNVPDLNCATYNAMTKKYYFGSYERGLLTWDLDTFTVTNDSTVGSTLVSAIPDANWVKITGLATDSTGNTWITNHETNGGPSIHKLDKEGLFTAYTLKNSKGEFPMDIALSSNGTKWITLRGPGLLSGIIAFDETTGNERLLTDEIGNGSLPVNIVTDLTIDLNDQVWVGTTEGVAIFDKPENVFDDNPFDVIIPQYNGEALLGDKEVKSISIDSQNRKWIGTSSGLFLYTETEEPSLIEFNIDNSPLPSNNIIDVGINQKTGEAFIGTDVGIISFKETPIDDEEDQFSVSIFPNPVHPNYEGEISFASLAENATVKITDTSGKLMYETTANNGIAKWNGQDYNGRKAKTGIYLIYSSSADGKQGLVGKLAVIE